MDKEQKTTKDRRVSLRVSRKTADSVDWVTKRLRESPATRHYRISRTAVYMMLIERALPIVIREIRADEAELLREASDGRQSAEFPEVAL